MSLINKSLIVLLMFNNDDRYTVHHCDDGLHCKEGKNQRFP